MRLVRASVVLFAVAVMFACGSGGGGGDTSTAVNAPYENNFDAPSPLYDWLFYDPNDSSTPPSATVYTLWWVDDKPDSMPGGTFASEGFSLNYNNDTDYNTGSNAGVAISPKVNIGGLTNPVLNFKCNYKTETTGTSYDKRYVKVGYLNSDGEPVYYYEGQLSTTPGSDTAGACAAMGTWHEHTIALDPSWGEIRIAFLFDSVDSYDNGHPGWFIDDFKLVEATSLTGGGDTGTGGGDTGTGGGDTGTGGGDTGTGGGDTGTGGGDTGTGGGTGGGNTGGTGGTTGGGNTVTVTVYTSDFDSTESVTSWTLGTGTGVVWANDATPGTFPGGVAKSGTNSLNYNDGTDYDNGQTNSGTAVSPPISLAGYTSPKLKFQCNFQTENLTGFDIRKLRIKSAGVETPVLDVQLLTANASPLVGNCAASGTWHEHTITLDPAWGTITVEFFFDTVDDYGNTMAGWAVDDFSVTGEQPASTGGGTGTGGDTAVAGSTETAGSGDDGGSGGSCGGSVTERPFRGALAWVLAAFLVLFGAGMVRKTVA